MTFQKLLVSLIPNNSISIWFLPIIAALSDKILASVFSILFPVSLHRYVKVRFPLSLGNQGIKAQSTLSIKCINLELGIISCYPCLLTCRQFFQFFKHFIKCFFIQLCHWRLTSAAHFILFSIKKYENNKSKS